MRDRRHRRGRHRHGFIGTVHVEALRRIGVQVHGVLGIIAGARRRPGRRRSASRAPTPPSTSCCADPRVEVVHVTSPNHLHDPQAQAILAAGRHVVCEKPLAMTAAESAELVVAAAASRPRQRGQLQHPLLPAQPARATAPSRRRARRHPARHRPLLPGLAVPGDRLELAARSRTRRRPAGVRRHRLPLGGPDELHHRPARHLGDGGAGDRHRRPPRADRSGRDLLDRASPPTPSPAPMATEDTALLLLRFANGARGAVAISPDQRRPQELAPVRDRRLDARRRPGTPRSPTSSGSAIATGRTRSCIRNPALMGPSGHAPPRACPAATSKASATPSRALSGPSMPPSSPGGRPPAPTYPTFADGHDEMLVGDAVAGAPGEGRWVDVVARHRSPPTSAAATRRPRPMKLGLLTAPFPETPLDRRRRLDRRERLREPRDRLLAAGHRSDPALRGHVPHRRREPVGRPGDARSSTRSTARA